MNSFLDQILNLQDSTRYILVGAVILLVIIFLRLRMSFGEAIKNISITSKEIMESNTSPYYIIVAPAFLVFLQGGAAFLSGDINKIIEAFIRCLFIAGITAFFMYVNGFFRERVENKLARFLFALTISFIIFSMILTIVFYMYNPSYEF